MEASWWERGTKGQTGSCSDGQGHTHICTQCPWLCSRPLLTHASTGDSWTLTGKSGSVSCGVTAPLSWVLVPISFSLCPPRVCSQSCVSSGSSMAWLMLTSSKRAYAVPRSAAPRSPAPVAVHCWPYLHRTHSDTVLAQSLGSLGPGAQGLLEPSERLWWVSGLIPMWFHPSYHFAGASPLLLDVGYLFVVGSSIFQLTVVQQWVVVLEFSQEMSARPSTLPFTPQRFPWYL